MKLDKIICKNNKVKVRVTCYLDKISLLHENWPRGNDLRQEYTIANGINALELWDGRISIKDYSSGKSWGIRLEDLDEFLYHISSIQYGSKKNIMADFSVGNGNYDITKNDDNSFNVSFIEDKITYLTVNTISFEKAFKLSDKFLQEIYLESFHIVELSRR